MDLSENIDKVIAQMKMHKNRLKLTMAQFCVRQKVNAWITYFRSRLIYHLVTNRNLTKTQLDRLFSCYSGAIKQCLGLSKALSREILFKTLEIPNLQELIDNVEDRVLRKYEVNLVAIKQPFKGPVSRIFESI